MIRTILALCSRDFGNELMYSQLSRILVAFQARDFSWEYLIHEAEKQGVAPLLHKHLNSLDFKLADNNRRLLQGLYLRNRRSNTIRNRAISEILTAYCHEKIDVLIVKGIALCNFAYSETGLRPMRDLDLLVKKIDLVKAEKVLFELGYSRELKHDIPNDYYHLVPMRRTIEGLPVSIEVHHNLLPFHPQFPLWPLEKSYETAMELEINGTKALTLCLEDTLWYVYLHGFRAPLTYEPFRFMHVADIVSLVDKFLGVINWQKVRKEAPIILKVLSRFNYLTPWGKNVIKELELDIRDRPGCPGVPYKGWPLRKLGTVKKTELLQLAKDTLWPSQWWVQIYYGCQGGPDYLKARVVGHPRMIWRWVRTYCSSYVKNILQSKK